MILSLAVFLLMIVSALGQQTTNDMNKIPEFELLDQHGELWKSADHAGKKALVIYFYPKDDTPGCTKEACAFRDSFEVFTDNNVLVVGISSDNVESHLNFAKKYQLPFTLLSDTDQAIRKLFGVKGNLFGVIPGRETFVFNEQGRLVHRFRSQLNAEKHIDEAIEALNIHP